MLYLKDISIALSENSSSRSKNRKSYCFLFFSYLIPLVKIESLDLAIAFSFGFLFIAMPLYLFLNLTVIPEFIAAFLSQVLLSLFGQSFIMGWAGGFPILTNGFYSVQIIGLCSGILEISVLAGIIFASMDVSFRNRVKGFVLGIFFIEIINVFRIVLSVLALGSNSFVFFHDFLFRLTLIIGIVMFYFFWYVLVEKQGFKKQEYLRF
jgi:exosortase/archaeosortase family protein